MHPDLLVSSKEVAKIALFLVSGQASCANVTIYIVHGEIRILILFLRF